MAATATVRCKVEICFGRFNRATKALRLEESSAASWLSTSPARSTMLDGRHKLMLKRCVSGCPESAASSYVPRTTPSGARLVDSDGDPLVREVELEDAEDEDHGVDMVVFVALAEDRHDSTILRVMLLTRKPEPSTPRTLVPRSVVLIGQLKRATDGTSLSVHRKDDTQDSRSVEAWLDEDHARVFDGVHFVELDDDETSVPLKTWNGATLVDEDDDEPLKQVITFRHFSKRIWFDPAGVAQFIIDAAVYEEDGVTHRFVSRIFYWRNNPQLALQARLEAAAGAASPAAPPEV